MAQDLEPAARQAQEAEAKSRLEALRGRMRALQAERAATQGAHTAVIGKLKEAELEVARIARDVRRVDEAIVRQEDEIAALERERAVLQARLDGQRHAIAALLRSAYALGRHAGLRVVFAPEDVARVGRLLAYHEYLQRDRARRVQALLEDLAALARVRMRLDEAQLALTQEKSQRQREADALATSRAAQQSALAALAQVLGDQRERLAALGKDEAGLLELLEQLRDAIADIPRVIAGSEPFATRRGRLPWPAAGKVQRGYGRAGADGRASDGLLIAATGGAEIHAVAHGRVAWADWLKGYGLLTIVDHGDGWMSLYAHSETLLKDVGDWVAAGEVLATAGRSGGQAEPGLYFELRQDGRPVDPSAWLARRAAR
jgi:septal ring factor EnvC (AmiA/AmiB activator)